MSMDNLFAVVNWNHKTSSKTSADVGENYE